MRTLILPILALALSCTACQGPVPSGSQAETPDESQAIDVTDSQMQAALEKWRSFEMPEPPAGAPLVVLTWPGISWVNGVKQPPERSVAFLIAEGDGKNAGRIFDGTREISNDRGQVTPFDPQAIRPADLRPRSWPRDSLCGYNCNFAMALHFWARGHREFARGLMGRAIAQQRYPEIEAGEPSAEALIQDNLSESVWGYWLDEAFQPGTDRRAIHFRLTRALGEFVYPEGYLPNFRESLTKLEASLRPSVAAQGSVEYWIDGLVDVCLRVHNQDVEWMPMSPEKPDVPRPLIELLCMGFDAVPALLEHVSDDRLTRSTSTPMFGGVEMPMCVGDFAGAIVRSLSGRELYGRWQEDAGTEEPVFVYDDLHAWWAETQGKDEKTCMLELAKGNAPGASGFFFGPNWMDAGVLVLSRKYPETLVELYVATLAGDEKVATDNLAKGIAISSLDREAKTAALLRGAEVQDIWRRATALRALRTVDDSLFAKLVAEHLDSLDGKLKRPYPYGSDAIQYTLLVQFTNDQRAWDALQRLTVRAEPNLRVRMLGRFGSSDDEIRDRGRWLGFLAGFLDDEDIRRREDDVTQCDPCLAWGTISIRNFAASRIGQIMGIEPTPEPGWDETRWAGHHRRVADALTAEGIELP